MSCSMWTGRPSSPTSSACCPEPRTGSEAPGHAPVKGETRPPGGALRGRWAPCGARHARSPGMCEIAGEIVFSGGRADVGAVARMTAEMERRGPDGGGIWDGGWVALGHRRLKVIDLSDEGAQPFVDDELGLSMVFNGCVYNHKELREEL